MTSQTPLAEGRHNHPPRCCCDVPPGDMDPADADPTYLCPGCPEHGDLAEPECPSCHTHDGHPHTEYCRATCSRCGSNRFVAISLDEGITRRAQCIPCGYIEAPALPDDWRSPHRIERAEQRPDDDAAPIPTCNGRNCGGRPHE